MFCLSASSISSVEGNSAPEPCLRRSVRLDRLRLLRRTYLAKIHKGTGVGVATVEQSQLSSSFYRFLLQTYENNLQLDPRSRAPQSSLMGFSMFFFHGFPSGMVRGVHDISHVIHTYPMYLQGSHLYPLDPLALMPWRMHRLGACRTWQHMAHLGTSWHI